MLGFVNLKKKEKSESNSNVGLNAWKLAEKLSNKNELPIVKDVLQKKVGHFLSKQFLIKIEKNIYTVLSFLSKKFLIKIEKKKKNIQFSEFFEREGYKPKEQRKLIQSYKQLMAVIDGKKKIDF